MESFVGKTRELLVEKLSADHDLELRLQDAITQEDYRALAINYTGGQRVDLRKIGRLTNILGVITEESSGLRRFYAELARTIEGMSLEQATDPYKLIADPSVRDVLMKAVFPNCGDAAAFYSRHNFFWLSMLKLMQANSDIIPGNDPEGDFLEICISDLPCIEIIEEAIEINSDYVASEMLRIYPDQSQ
jgi:hypothetical protein